MMILEAAVAEEEEDARPMLERRGEPLMGSVGGDVHLIPPSNFGVPYFGQFSLLGVPQLAIHRVRLPFFFFF